MLATLAPRGYVNELRHLLEPEDEYNTLVIHQDESAALRCVAAAESLPRDLDRWQGSSVELCRIDGVSIRLTANNNLHIKLPGLGRRFVYDFSPGPKSLCLRSRSGYSVFFDRRFPLVFQSQDLVDKLADLLERQRAVQEREIEDDLCNPPADLLEEEIEETPALLDLLR